MMANRLARIRAVAKAHHARVVAVSIPNWPYVSSAKSMRRLGFVLSDEMSRTGAPDDEARRACAQAGVGFISVTEEIRRRAAASAPLFYPLDGHLTSEGQRLFAEALAPELSRALASARNVIDRRGG